MKFALTALLLANTAISSLAFAVDSFEVPGQVRYGRSFLNPIHGPARCEFFASGQWTHGDYQITDANGNGTKYGPCGSYGVCHRPDLKPGTLVARLSAGEWDFSGEKFVIDLAAGQTVDFAMNDTLSSFYDNNWNLRVEARCDAL